MYVRNFDKEAAFAHTMTTHTRPQTMFKILAVILYDFYRMN